ncbi:hypothetical protein [Mediterranea massiliensis]|uniref:hypothetical protein n=1 Tax=Mediterranea massiliensis TaxID=1841865 RepID=UPI0009329E1C|nr:hypothetical protein [Mediterranea massiliensis]
MGKIIWIIVGIIIYFGGGWIAKDIVFSMIEITNETTLKDLASYEFITYSIIAGIVSFIASIYEDNEIGYISLLAIGITCGVAKEMPFSIGLIILYNIINVGGIIWAICTNKHIK